MLHDDLDNCRRMRASLLAILDLDPEGVTARVKAIDAEITRLEDLLGLTADSLEHVRRLEIIPIGVPVKAA